VLASWSDAIKPVWTSNAETKEVISAAEEPRPVLATSARATPVKQKGSSFASEEREMDQPRFLSCEVRKRGRLLVRSADLMQEEI
jgi:hypothetical protein